MKGDFSRNSFDPNKHYRGVRMQQGRVQMDADWNEQIDITDHRDRLFTEDFLGDAVGPSMGAGFAIGVAPDQQDLTVGLGRYYVNGLLVENSNSLYFTNQTDYPNATLPTQDGVYLAYLDVWQRSLSVADDADIAESALGGADTATRLYTVAQVKLMPVDSTDITNLTYNALFDVNAAIDSPAYNNAQQWNAMANRLPSNMETTQLLPDVTTMTSSVDTTYRIQIHQGGNVAQATYKTSIDNPLVEPTIGTINGNIITLPQAPNGQAPFAVGQWLELTTPQRDASKLPGDMTQITDISGDDVTGLTITLSGVIGADINIANAALARRWQQNATRVTNSNLETGLAINFLGNAFESGNYWQITTDATNHTINWPSSNGKFIALPPNSTTISQLTPSINSPTLQNQLYRVEIHQGGDASTASFKWSRDNASVSSSISAISSNNITLSTLPQDGINGFMVYQWLELTTPTRELTGVPGDMVQITAVNGATLTVSGAIDADITVANNAIARRWDTAVTSSASRAVNPITTSTALALENGLSVTFAGSDFRTGDYWLIPARAALNSQGSHIDWPMDDSGNYLTQLPDGIQHSDAPLAIVQRSNGEWNFESDARTLVTPLSWLDVIGVDPGAPADTIHVDRYGQVGISTDTPSAKLDVEGTFLVNGGKATLNNGLSVNGGATIDSLTINDTNSGTFSVTPAPDKVPVADQSGHINAGWLAGGGAGFTTGDTKLTYKNVADVGWIMMNDGTIGNANSGATARANADTQDLFVLLWNNISQANCPVSGGRGASALEDFNADKTIQLPRTMSRVPGVAGSGSGLTTRNLADIVGEEKHALTADENGPHTHGYTTYTNLLVQSGSSTPCWNGTRTVQTGSSGLGTPHNTMQPTSFLNMMIKL
jgi:hypothetical protein